MNKNKKNLALFLIWPIKNLFFGGCFLINTKIVTNIAIHITITNGSQNEYGGPQGELGAALRYLNQRYTMPDEKGKALLTAIGTEELAHVEIISTMLYQLTKDATPEEMKKSGLDTHFTEYLLALFPTDANGVPFTYPYISATGDPVTDLSKDMAAEEKARALYEKLIDLATDPDVIEPFLWLR